MTTKKQAPVQEEPKEKLYYIVNKAGCIHIVDYDHAKRRLGQLGFRMATKEEVAAYKENNGFQRSGRPLAKPYSNEPVFVPEPEENAE